MCNFFNHTKNFKPIFTPTFLGNFCGYLSVLVGLQQKFKMKPLRGTSCGDAERKQLKTRNYFWAFSIRAVKVSALSAAPPMRPPSMSF